MGGGGASTPGPSAQELQNQALTNQLLQQQIADQAAARKQEAYKQSPEYLNKQWQADQTKQATDWNASKNTDVQKAKQQIQQAWNDLGDPNGAAPYLAQVDQAAANLHYTPGENYHYDAPDTAQGFDEAQYVAANPDVARGIALAQQHPEWGGFTSGLEHYQQYGKAEGRNGTFTISNAPNQHVIGGTSGVFDDPGTLLNSDYGATAAITGVRQGRKDASYNTALGKVDTYLKGLGLNDADYNSLNTSVRGSLKNIYDTAGTTSNDYSKVFDPQTILDSTVGAERNLRRGQYTTQAKAAFSKLDPDAAFSDTADDQYINDIVGTQYNDAFGALDRAYKRGALTDTGYKAGLSELGTQRDAATSTANSLGGAVLTRDRGALSDIRGKAVTDAGAYDFGQTYDPNSYVNQYNTKLGGLQGNLKGDIATALQGQNFFDVGATLNKAGFAQGAQNTNPLTTDSNSPDYLAALGDKDKNKTNTRGLGGTGVF